MVILFAICYLSSAVYAQDEGSTCRYPEGDQICTGTIQGGRCQYDAAYVGKFGKDCQKQGSADSIFGHVDVPAPIAGFGIGSVGVGVFLSNLIQVIYVFAVIMFMFMIILAAFQWIISGGDKEAVAKARQRIFNAFIGLMLLALAPLVFTVVGQITGFKFPLELKR